MIENLSGSPDKMKLKQEILSDIGNFENISDDPRTKAIIGNVSRPLREALNSANQRSKQETEKFLSDAEAELEVLEKSIGSQARDQFSDIRRKIRQLL